MAWKGIVRHNGSVTKFRAPARLQFAPLHGTLGGVDAAAFPMRKIIHVDMDAFFASVEQRDDPSLRGKPVAVGGSAARGVVAAASYEARAFGVRSAMPSVTAARLCPDLIFVKSRFEAYRAVSAQIRDIFARHTDLIQPLSLDEAYLDVTEDKQGIGSAVKIARAIRAAIHAETGLTASAGVATNKLVAKLASDQNKPDGLCVVMPGDEAAFVQALPVRRLHGVGPRMTEKLAAIGITSCAELAAAGRAALVARFGDWGDTLHRMAFGIDARPVRAHSIRKSISSEDTFPADLSDSDALHAELARIGRYVWEAIERKEIRGRSVTVKAKYADFRIVTRSTSLPRPVADRAEFLALGAELLDRLLPPPMGVRLLGIGLHGLLHLDGEPEADPAQPTLDLWGEAGGG